MSTINASNNKISTKYRGIPFFYFISLYLCYNLPKHHIIWKKILLKFNRRGAFL